MGGVQPDYYKHCYHFEDGTLLARRVPGSTAVMTRLGTTAGTGSTATGSDAARGLCGTGEIGRSPVLTATRTRRRTVS
jgi:hypothetical protein